MVLNITSSSNYLYLFIHYSFHLHKIAHVPQRIQSAKFNQCGKLCGNSMNITFWWPLNVLSLQPRDSINREKAHILLHFTSMILIITWSLKRYRLWNEREKNSWPFAWNAFAVINYLRTICAHCDQLSEPLWSNKLIKMQMAIERKKKGRPSSHSKWSSICCLTRCKPNRLTVNSNGDFFEQQQQKYFNLIE